MSIDQTGAVEVLRMDPDEASRALLGTVMGQPGAIVRLTIGALVLLVVVGFGAMITFGARDFVFGPIFMLMGVLGICALPLATRWKLRVKLAKSIAEAGENSLRFSATGIDTKSPHTAAHFDWVAVRGVRTVPQGLLIQLGTTTLYVSKKSFEGESEYSRVLDLLSSRMGARVLFERR